MKGKRGGKISGGERGGSRQLNIKRRGLAWGVMGEGPAGGFSSLERKSIRLMGIREVVEGTWEGKGVVWRRGAGWGARACGELGVALKGFGGGDKKSVLERERGYDIPRPSLLTPPFHSPLLPPPPPPFNSSIVVTERPITH